MFRIMSATNYNLILQKSLARTLLNRPPSQIQQLSRNYRKNLKKCNYNLTKLKPNLKMSDLNRPKIINYDLNPALQDTHLKRYGTSPSLFIFKHLRQLNPAVINLNKLFEGPTYGTNPEGTWSCTHKLKWPQEITFVASGTNPLQANYRSLVACVVWLEKNHPLPKSFLLQNTTTLKEERDAIISLIKESSSESVNSLCCNNNNNNILTRGAVLGAKSDSRVLNSSVRNYSVNAADEANEAQPGRKILVAKRTLESNELPQQNSNETEVTDKPKLEVKTDLDSKIYENLEEVSKIFSVPKVVLHNFYTDLSTQLKKRELQVNPQYKLNRLRKNLSNWNCTYHVLWPKDMKFVATGNNKKDASSKAALVVLTWLYQNKLITKEGRPELFNKEEIKELTRPTSKPITLHESAVNNLNQITNIYEQRMIPYIQKTRFTKKEEEENNNNETNSMLTETTDIPFLTRRQKFLGSKTYKSKEKVSLPISLYKHEFMDLIRENRAIILKGEPGCGKSTRIPQYVLEHWATNEGVLGEPCRIAVTQPRRIAAISLAERVANERSELVGDLIGYHVRFRSNFNHSTARVIYCTTGILLRHIQSDPKLSSFTHIILDEAHERDVNTDLLMNLTRKALTLNPKLKVVVMSATIDTTMFQDYFNNVPVMHIPGFTHPVKQHFLDSCRSIDLSKTQEMCESNVPNVIHEDVVKVIKHIHKRKPEGAILCFLPGWDDISKVKKLIPYSNDISVLCLHSRLQDAEQYKIFSKPPPGVRKVILATNIAETSVTIDDVVYVIDTGIQKEQRFDFEKGVSIIDNRFISQASMTQRKGRAGRVRPGESYHLYPQSTFDNFEKYTLPEILKTSLTKIVLNSKVYSNNMNALEFMNELPTPPKESAILSAVDELKDLDLLDEQENLTSLGKTLADFQLEPKLSKAMVNSVVYKCVTPVVDIVTLFASDMELFASGLANKEMSKKVKTQFSKTSDHLALMRLLEKYLELREDGDNYKLERFVADANLLTHKLTTVDKLRKVHFDYLYNGLFDILQLSDDFSNTDELVKGVILSGVGTVLQRRNWDIIKGHYKKANVLLTRNNHKATITSDSVNCVKQSTYPSDFLLYLNETRSNIRRMTIIRESSLIPPLSVLLFMDKNIEMTELSGDQVELCLKGTTIKFTCNKQQGEAIINCKRSLSEVYKFYIYLLTQGGDYHPNINETWHEMLKVLSETLNMHKI